jgi:5-hydroxyisourate hydrolase
VLDTVLGKPAARIRVRLEVRPEKHEADTWAMVCESETDADGRCPNLAQDALAAHYRLTFGVGAYFERQGRTSIYPEIFIVFICDGMTHFHLPLLLSDNSYTTYRGS